MRRAVGKQKPKSPVSSPKSEPVEKGTSPSAMAVDVQPTIPDSAPTGDGSAFVASGVAPDVAIGLTAEIVAPEGKTTPHTTEQAAVPEVADIQSEAEGDAATQGLRRTTRIRKQLHGVSDVFGTIVAPRAAPSRRRTILPFDNSAFSGMTALALKTLTTTNTQRNQRQVVEIFTEVVIKEGRRPDSPTTKVRTSLERQREERVRQR